MKEKKKLKITADCVCDLPFGMLEENEVEIIYFHLVTENGSFLDRDEISADNVFEHMDNGGLRAESVPPTVQEYVDFFRKNLRESERVLHITISSKLSDAYKNAKEATLRMGFAGERVDIVDSESVSTGMAFLILKAAEMCKAEEESGQIIRELNLIKKRVSTTYISQNALYLYLNDKVKLATVKLVEMFQLHPVFKVSDGKIKLKFVLAGSDQNAVKTYIRWQLKKMNKINNKMAFLTHSGCNVKTLSEAKKEVEDSGSFKDVIVSKASACISSNCGPGTVGIIYLKKK